MNKRSILLFILSIGLWLIPKLSAQVVTTDPIFPTAGNPVTITYDATQGVGNLEGASRVFMHSGVVLSGPDGTGWENVVGEWGNPNAPGEMTQVSGQPDKWQITITPNTYYSVTGGETIYRIGMVFREAGPCGGFAGSGTPCAEGKSETGGDIFVEVYPPGLQVAFTNPTQESFFADINVPIDISAGTSQTADMSITVNGNPLISANGVTSLSDTYTPTATGRYDVVVTATSGGETVEDEFSFVVSPPTQTQARPAGIKKGIYYNNSNPNQATLSLEAPGKNMVYLIGDFNDWQLDPVYQLKKDGDYFWITINGLTAGTEYAFQYLVDETIRVADPYADKVLDPNNDQFIDPSIYPSLKPYPTGKTTGVVSVLQTNQSPYNWQTTGYTRPNQEHLVVYELLVRDFSDERSFQAVIDTLDYLENLGINALGLMPINEFDGNLSWGYNPTFYFAVDKAYGTKNKFKELVDECHARGIAVILDLVLNHTHERSPFAALYWDQANFRPSADNPWLNQEAKHPFNVFFDFNHESERTKALLDSVNRYWIEEYKVDGFRYDLSKGFTQNATTDVGAWSAYDASRVALLKRMADELWALDSEAYIILEHFADNSEETELANYGMMFWGNINHNFNQATMGFNDDNGFAWTYHGTRGWNDPHVLAYMESHDEERLMYRNLNFGNQNADHNTRDENTALERMKAATACFFTIPGPKMIWQFGELGYDYSINRCGDGSVNNDCRTDIKPVGWEFYNDAERQRLLKVYRMMLDLHASEAVRNGTYELSEFNSGLMKRIKISHASMNIVLIANFGMTAANIDPSYHNTGTWYDYFSDDETNVTDVNYPILLQPGQFHILTSVEQPLLEAGLTNFLLPSRVQPAPLAPTGLTATALNTGASSSISLSWTDNADSEEDFVLERSTTDNNNFTAIATLPANTTSYLDNTVQTSRTYFYRVKARNQSGNQSSDYSNEASVTITSAEARAFAKQVKLYPNPSQGLVSLHYAQNYQGALSLRLLDTRGQMLKTWRFDKSGRAFDAMLDLSKLPKGAYLLEITQQNGLRAVKRLVKE